MYRVPTYGKIYKIIDFGRATYKYKDRVLFSDSFDFKGDASTQYNCEPYYNKKKNKVEPNFSFDLCRLGCSLFDYFFDSINEAETITDEIKEFVNFLCLDDNNKNILYKSTDRDRFPEFKLYKMIARIVHNKIPKDLLSIDMFKHYHVNKVITDDIIDIDSIPKMFNV